VIQQLQRALGRRRSHAAGPSRDAAADWRPVLERRLFVAAAILGMWALGIEVRLAYLQIFRYADLVTRAARQQLRPIPAPAERGDIIDRRGHVLATSLDADSIYAIPTEIGDAAQVTARLCEALGDCRPQERRALAERLRHQHNFAYVRRQRSPDEVRRVAALNLDGIGFMKESRRFYPNRELGGSLLGYVGVDNVGLAGIESAYDAEIRGKPGTMLVQTDARRHAFSRTERPPTAGSTVELTIDEYLQHVAERELHAGVLENRASGGTAIIMDPHTGEILALANEPTFNPNAYRDWPENDRRNRAVQDLYEPGSTFKVVTASAAIDDKVVPLDSLIDVRGGRIRLGSRVVHDTHDYGVLSFTDVIVKSSNVGAIKIGFRVGADRLGEYVRRYGFGRGASPDFPGESPGIVWSTWSDSALMSVSMGYQVGVTALQMATAVSAVANGGILVEPRVLRAIYREGRRDAVEPRAVRRTTSAETAAALTTIMEQVVERGTAKAARLSGFTVAGKTGTAAKLINGHYSYTDYNASFVGFVPSRDPAVTIIVVIDSPRAGAHVGGLVSAPIFKRIAQSTLQYLGISPTVQAAGSPESPPRLRRAAEASAKVAAPADSVIVGIAATDTAGTRETGAGGADPVISLLADGEDATVPDLRGLSAREALGTLVKLGLTVRMTGDGFVASQDPPPGIPLAAGSVCRLVLDRAMAAPLAAPSRPLPSPGHPGLVASPPRLVNSPLP
jgi:cell division protein FtsI (penicillin-binding protein 3)